MDIQQLKYFITIVESQFSLTSASKKLQVSQPALTQAVRKFELEESVQIFKRSRGRLVGLTPIGENLYENAKVIIQHHDNMIREVRENVTNYKGTVTIGIPPLVLTVLFSELLSKLIKMNPKIQFKIIEEGVFELRRKMLLHEIDFVVLIQPGDLNPQHYREEIIHRDVLKVYMDENNPLAVKDKISWTDLRHQDLAIFSESYIIHHKLMKKFSSENVIPSISIMSSSWDFLLGSVSNSNSLTILPSPVLSHIRIEGIVEKEFTDPLEWNVVLCHPIKNHYTRIEAYIKQNIIRYFSGESLSSISEIEE